VLRPPSLHVTPTFTAPAGITDSDANLRDGSPCQLPAEWDGRVLYGCTLTPNNATLSCPNANGDWARCGPIDDVGPGPLARNLFERALADEACPQRLVCTACINFVRVLALMPAATGRAAGRSTRSRLGWFERMKVMTHLHDSCQ
jgi:hypothetical protein